MIKAPKFWYEDDILSKVIAFLVYPLSIIWIVIAYIKKNMSIPYKSKLKVICIGNLNIGGTGKTPFTIYTYKILKELGYKPAFLTRGYGGLEKGPLKVKPKHNYRDVGDEALLLNKVGPTILSTDRSQGAKFIENHRDSYDIILMDDGLQNNQLEKNIKLLLVDKKLKFGNEFCIPAGPLREPINSGLSNVDGIILTGNNEKNTDLKNKLAQKPIFNSSIKAIKSSKIKDNKFMAFCGLANPDKFNETLHQNKYNIILTKSFPDHYQYTEEDINNLILDAKSKDLELITTEKDYVKIKNKKNEINVLSIESNLEKTDEKKFKMFLEEKLNE